MTYEIACTHGPMKGRRWNVTQHGLKIGRAEGCEIQLDDVAAELYHCVVKLVDGKPSVQNLASDNGVDVNGTNVDEAELGSNDTIRIGNERFILLASGDEKGGSGARVAVAACALFLALAGAAFVIWRKGQAKSVVAPPAATNAVAQVEAPVTTNRVVRIVTEELVTTNRVVSVVDNVVVTNYVVEVRRNGELVSSAELPEKDDEYVAAPECSDGLVLSEDGKTLVSVPKDLTSVAIPNGVTTIGDRAFANHKALVHVSIPPSVTKIGRDAFRGCDNMTGVFIADLAAWCRLSLECQDLPWTCSKCDSVQPLYQAHNLYVGCKLVRDMVIPKEATNIGKHAFRGCTSLTSVTILDGVSEIGPGVFSHCSNLVKIEVSAANRRYKSVGGLLLTKDGKTLVSVPCGLESVTIPAGVVSIADRAFEGCKRLSKIRIPDGVTHIGYSAFVGCSGLVSVEMPPSVLKAGDLVFAGCNGLEGVYISDLSAWCRISVGGRGTLFGNGCGLFLNGSIVQDLELPKDITSVGFAFRGCTSLTRVKIPRSVDRIAGGAFANCCNFVAFEVEGGNPKYKSKNGLVVSKDGKTLIAVPSGLTSIIIPDNVVAIADGAFVGCAKLSNITIPDGVESVGWGAFSRCVELTSITIPNSVKQMGSSVVMDCFKLASVTIPGSVDRIDGLAFAFDFQLANVTIEDGVKSIGKGAFQNARIKSITIPNSVTNIDAEAFANCWALESVTIPADLKNIHETAFVGCDKLMDANKRPRLTRVFSDGKK